MMLLATHAIQLQLHVFHAIQELIFTQILARPHVLMVIIKAFLIILVKHVTLLVRNVQQLVQVHALAVQLDII